MPKIFWLLVALVCAIGCGREERDINNGHNDAQLQSCREGRANLMNKVRDLENQLSEAKNKAQAKPLEEDPRQCTLAFAKDKNPRALEILVAKQKAATEDFKQQCAELEKNSAEAKALSISPPKDFPPAPTTVSSVRVLTSDAEAFYDSYDKRCHLREVYGKALEAFVEANDWGHFFWKVKENFQDNENQDDLEYDDYRSSLRTIEMFDSPASGRELADKILSLLVKSSPSMQWAVGLVLRLEDKGFVKVRLQRLYTASKTDFQKLSQGVADAETLYQEQHPEAPKWQVEAGIPEEFQFAIAEQDGNYYKGLLLRYWRYKEAEGKGGGNKFVRDLQKVIKQVAKGMKVNLQ